MQEEIEKKTIALAISGSKITGRTLAKAISVYLNHRKGKLPDLKHGRQTIKDLMKHNTALSNIEITDKNIRSGGADIFLDCFMLLIQDYACTPPDS